MEKSELRKKQLKIRKEIQNKDEKSLAIVNQVIELEEYNKAESIGIYVNLPVEVNTLKLIELSLRLGKKVSLPKVIDDSMIFIEVYSLDDLIKSDFGVYEPKFVEDRIVKSSEIELMIVPGVAFDLKCNRLGFGKGYYDTYLNNRSMLKIALAFDEQIVDEIETEPKDVKMDAIITENRIITK